MIFAFVAILDPPVTPLRWCRARKPLPGSYEEDELSDSDVEAYGEYLLGPLREADAKGSLGFIRISHVCTAWRSILLSMRRVWADNIGILPLATTDMVARAGTYPLTVSLGLFSLHGVDINDLIEAPAIRAVHGTISKYNRSSHCIHALLSSMRRGTSAWHTLETVDLSVHGSEPRPKTKTLHTPSLCYLSMQNFFFRFFAPSLQHLTITFRSSRDGVLAMSMISLLSMLRSCRLTLRELKLLHCFAPDFMPSDSTDPIALPSLRRLDVGGYSVSLLGSVQRCLTYPATCDVAFHALSDFSRGEDATSDLVLHRALRIFSDEVLSRTGSYGFGFNTLDNDTPFISVHALSPESSSGQGELFIALPDLGARRVYFDSKYIKKSDVFYALSVWHTLIPAPNLDFSALGDVRVLSVVHTSRTRNCQGATYEVFYKMPALRVLHLHGLGDDIMFQLASGHNGQVVLPDLQVIRLSAGHPMARPVSLALLRISLCTRAAADASLPEGQVRPLPRLIVDRDVEFDKSVEEENLTVEFMKEEGSVDEVYWKQ